jgi:hypothetical protein
MFMIVLRMMLALRKLASPATDPLSNPLSLAPTLLHASPLRPPAEDVGESK